MNADELDDRIRSLVHDAVAAAPAAPDLPAVMPSGMPVIAPPNRGRGWVWAGIGIAASVIAGAVLVMTNRNDDPSIVAGSTSSGASTTAGEPQLPWPDGVAVIVASERGIEKVTAENGQAVVTRLLDGVSVDRAFELEDGTIIYQTSADGVIEALRLGQRGQEPANESLANDVTLEDADAPDGNLRLVYRSASDDPSSATQVNVWFQPNAPLSTQAPGGFGVGYHRFTIVDDSSVIASTIDDTGQRSTFGFSFGDGEQIAPGFEQPIMVAGDGAGTYLVLGKDGRLDMTGTRSGHITTIDDPSPVIDMDVRGQWMTVHKGDGSMMLIDMVTGAPYQLPVSGGGGNISVSRRDRVDTQPVPTTVPSPSTSLEPGPTTTTPVTVAEPFPNCLTVSSDVAADVQFDSEFSSFDPPVPEAPIEVAGRPAVLTTFGTGFGVIFRQPDWCTEYGITTNTMSRADFLAWLGTLNVVENLPATIPPVLLRSTYGLSIVSADGTKVIIRGAVDQSLLLADGRVVYHAVDLADVQMWDPATGRSEPIWAAVDWIAEPMLHDAFGTSFVFSVNDQLYSYDTDRTWRLTGQPTQRISVFGDGELLATPDAPAAMDPTGELQVSALPGGEVVVLRFAAEAILYRSVNSDSMVTDVDIADGWMIVSEAPPGDSLPVVRMVEIATGRELIFRGVDGAHLG